MMSSRMRTLISGWLRFWTLAAMIVVLPSGTLFATDRPQGILDRGELLVCIWPAYYGISFRNPRDGTLRGIDIDLSRHLAADLGVTVRHIDSSFVSFMDDLDRDRCDIAMFGVGITPARQARVDLSEPHLRSSIYAVTTKTSLAVRRWEDLDRSGRIIAVQQGTIMEPFAHAYLKQAKVMVVAPPATREEEVLSGRADAFLTDYPYSLRMLFQHDWARVIPPPGPLGETSYGYAVKKDQPAWLARVNAFVATVKRDGRLEAAAKAHDMEPIILRN